MRIEHLASPQDQDCATRRCHDETQKMLAQLLARSGELKRRAATRARTRRFTFDDPVSAA